MKTEEIAILSLITSFVLPISINILSGIINRRVSIGTAKLSEGDAAEHLSQAAKTQIDTYVNLIVKPLEVRLSETECNLAKAQAELKTKSSALDDLSGRFSKLEEKLRRTESALDYLTEKTQATFPDDVKMAIRIRQGNLAQQGNTP